MSLNKKSLFIFSNLSLALILTLASYLKRYLPPIARAQANYFPLNPALPNITTVNAILWTIHPLDVGVAFTDMTDRSGENQVYVMNADGSNVIRASTGITGSAIEPNWRPVN